MNKITKITKKAATSLALLISALILLTALSPALAATPQPTLGPRIRIGNSTNYSTNWSGYAVTGSSGSVTSASGSWIVQTVTGSKRTTAYSSFWVGIDGFSSSTVEQIGTDSDLRNGKAVYYAWYEFYPNPMVQIPMTIKPGDTISASVTYSAGTFTVQLTDTSTNQQFQTSATVAGATESSAEWIAEAPSSTRGVLPLANFGTVAFGQDNTGVTTTCQATINGATGSIGSFGASIQSITMVTNRGMIKAQPSALSSDGTSFTVTWKHS